MTSASSHQGLYDQALSDYQEALIIAREIGDRAGEGTRLNNIGLVYEAQGLYDQALSNLQDALVIAIEIGNGALKEVIQRNIKSVTDDGG